MNAVYTHSAATPCPQAECKPENRASAPSFSHGGLSQVRMHGQKRVQIPPGLVGFWLVFEASGNYVEQSDQTVVWFEKSSALFRLKPPWEMTGVNHHEIQSYWIHRFDFGGLLYPNWGFPGGASAKNPPANAGDTRDVGLIPESGRSPGERNGSLFLENPVVRESWQLQPMRSLKSWT